MVAAPAAERWSVMRRSLFNFAAAGSLVLCAATVALFVHSGFRYVYLDIGTTPAHAHWEFGSARGRIYCTRVVYLSGYRDLPGWVTGGGPGSGPAMWSWSLGGFDFYHLAGSPTRPDFRQFVVPDYFLVLVSLVLPAWWWRMRRHPRPGRCPVCGYDLRATPVEGGALLDRCPECGTVPGTIPIRPVGAAA